MWSSLLGRGKPKKVEPAKPKVAAPPAAYGPPLTAEEQKGNLSELEKKLNAQMKCPAGKNQVFIRSLVLATGTTQPRVAMKCQLRKDVALPVDVFYEHIRDVCCSSPESCPAYKQFKDRFVPT